MSAAAYRQLRLAYLVAVYPALVMTLLHAGRGRQGDITNFLFPLALAMMVTMACAYDAAARGQPWAFGVRLPFLIFWPAAVPLYMIRSRGLWGCCLFLIHLGLLVGFIVAFTIAVALIGFLGR